MSTHNDHSPAGDAQKLEIVEYTDPFCSWAWGTEPKLRRLRLALGAEASWRQVIGILYDESAGVVEDPAAEVEAQYGRWADVIVHTGSPIPARLEWPVSSSWPASRAIKAAELQGPGLGSLVLRRLRESLFLVGRPGVDPEAIAEALAGLPGLDVEVLLADLDDDSVQAAADSDWEETRNPLDAVIGLTEPPPHPGAAAPDRDRLRYRFPTLVFRGPQGTAVVPGWRDYDVYVDAVTRVAPEATISTGRLSSADDALELFETLTEADLVALTASGAPPTSAVSLKTRNGSIWVRRDRAFAAADRT